MREILFRGKRIDSELWVEGSLVNNIFFVLNQTVLYRTLSTHMNMSHMIVWKISAN